MKKLTYSKKNDMDRNKLYIIVAIVTTSLISGSVTANVFAQPPDKGYKSSADCSTKYAGGIKKTCCWRTSNGTSLGDTYCQTCTVDSNGQPITCGQPELQFRSTSGNVPNSNDDGSGGVLKDLGISTKGTNDNMPIDGGVLSNQP